MNKMIVTRIIHDDGTEGSYHSETIEEATKLAEESIGLGIVLRKYDDEHYNAFLYLNGRYVTEFVVLGRAG